jgi:hypothetical protein
MNVTYSGFRFARQESRPWRGPMRRLVHHLLVGARLCRIARMERRSRPSDRPYSPMAKGGPPIRNARRVLRCRYDLPPVQTDWAAPALSKKMSAGCAHPSWPLAVPVIWASAPVWPPVQAGRVMARVGETHGWIASKSSGREWWAQVAVWLERGCLSLLHIR